MVSVCFRTRMIIQLKLSIDISMMMMIKLNPTYVLATGGGRDRPDEETLECCDGRDTLKCFKKANHMAIVKEMCYICKISLFFYQKIKVFQTSPKLLQPTSGRD